MDYSQTGVIMMMLGGAILTLTICDDTRIIERSVLCWKWRRPAAHTTFICLSTLLLIFGNMFAWGIIE